MVLRLPVGRIAVCLIAIIHSIFLYEGLNSTIYEKQFYSKDDALEYEENAQALFLYTVHFVLIFTLFYSTIKNATSCLLPWLLVTLPGFLYITFVVAIDLDKSNVIDIMKSLFEVGVCWLLWAITFFVFKTGEYRYFDISLLYLGTSSKDGFRRL